MLQIPNNKGTGSWAPGPTASLAVVTPVGDGAFGSFPLREAGDQTDSEEHEEK